MMQRVEAAREVRDDTPEARGDMPGIQVPPPTDGSRGDRGAASRGKPRSAGDAPRVEARIPAANRKRRLSAASTGRAGKARKLSTKFPEPEDDSTVWLVDVDLERNHVLREKLVELALALARRVADQDHEAALARRAAAASGTSAPGAVTTRGGRGNRRV